MVKIVREIYFSHLPESVSLKMHGGNGDDTFYLNERLKCNFSNESG